MTMNPFDFWAGMWRGGQAMMDTASKAAETVEAAGTVIDSRSRMLAKMAHDPTRAGYAELSRMVPEKIAAFSQAGTSVFEDLQAVQTHAMANWMMISMIALKGRVPTAREIGILTSRSTAIIERGARAGGKALAPVHRGATSNARRLKRAAPTQPGGRK
jgi:hypothetical protein